MVFYLPIIPFCNYMSIEIFFERFFDWWIKVFAKWILAFLLYIQRMDLSSVCLFLHKFGFSLSLQDLGMAPGLFFL